MKNYRQWLQKLKRNKWVSVLKRYKVLQIVVPAAVIAFVYWQGRHEIRRIDWASTLHFIRSITPINMAWLILFSLVAVAVISGYDFIIRRHFRLPIGPWATFRYSWIANTSNSVIGFAGIAGASLRTILYRKRGIPMPTIAASLAYLSTITITGLSLLAWAGILGILPIQGVLNAHPWTRYIVWADALFLPAFIIVQRTRWFAKWFNRDRGLLDWGTIGVSIGVSLLEWLLAGITFWLISTYFLPGITVREALGIYTVAVVTGLVSMAPGGIGGFDLTALLGLGLLGYDPVKTAAVLVLFRLFYYIVPWVIGLVMAAFEFAKDRFAGSARVDGVEPVLNRWQKIWQRPGQWENAGEIGAWALGKLVFAGGFVLLLSAATPRLLYRLRIADAYLPQPFMQWSHFLSVIVGFMLIILSWGISHRLERAYWSSVILLVSGAVFTFAKAFDFEEALFLLIVLVLLWISRGEFHRSAVRITRRDVAAWGLSTLTVLLVYIGIATGTVPRIFHHLPPEIRASSWMNPTRHAITAVAALAVSWFLVSLLLILRKR
ncbi:lysylphosphatidylglycerol synthetase family protein [Cohnella pontilimi]|uniref:Phosphatidylglycerol lysyltransferase n=1 Tax=Cohnella pontilimi TaxID=2564100 RepID=A0A4U0FGA5_9BACL|nr:lysylphosphatidylglycerol synthase domain-containing protein [Cohnella pontilimi]TJY44023.1 lysylphosphatidylglycerol synthetase family protein [Cohnella pontilimi]